MEAGGGTSRVSVVLVAAVGSRIAPALDGRVLLVGATDDLDEATRLVRTHGPRVAVVDLETAAAGVRDIIGPLTAAAPDTSVLAVARRPEHADVLAAVRAGAAGFVGWSGGASSLVDAVRRTAAGDAVFSPGLAEVVLEAHGGLGGGGPVRLTGREADVLRLVVEGLTGRQIATRLGLSPRTVENHVQHILRKLDVPNRAALVRYAIENGLA